MERRNFLKLSSATALSTPIVAQSAEFTPIRVGLIGAGGRGSWLADLFAKESSLRITAVADFFQDRVDGVGEKHGIDPKRRFTGLDSYRKMIDAGNLDAVAIISPPYFHPAQAEAAVEAELHVWLAKPVAVDVPGCQSVESTGKDATKKGLAFLVDFQTRADPFYMEAIKRVHDGALGTPAFGQCFYHSGRLGAKAEPGDPQARLRNWVFDQRLSGDIITEQNIHTLDVMSWIMNKNPLSASGTGGRKVRTDVGDTWDNFTLIYDYGDGVGISFSSRQFNAHGASGGIINQMFGEKGVLETKYAGRVLIRGGKDAYYQGGESKKLYSSGVVANIKAFEKAIREGDASNPTIAPSVQSNLVSVLGREAAYSGKTVAWESLMKDQTRIDAGLEEFSA